MQESVMLDACARKIKAQYSVWPSARASQAVSKCRKQHGVVRKTAKGRSLKRWTKEKWKDTITKKPCGHKGPGVEYCRPSKKVSKRTPKMPRGQHLRRLQGQKMSGKRPRA